MAGSGVVVADAVVVLVMARSQMLVSAVAKGTVVETLVLDTISTW